MVSYCMSKAGIEMLTKSSAVELAPLGIRVNCVAPGLVDTNLYRYAGLSEIEYEALQKRAADNNPFQRNCTDQEVAKAVIFLTSDKASKITGHIMKVDGAKSLTTRG